MGRLGNKAICAVCQTIVLIRTSRTSMEMGRTKFTTSGAHDVIAITSPQKNDLCTEKLSHWTRSVYHLESYRFCCL